MSLSDHYQAAAPPKSQCKTCRWYDELDAADKAFFDSKIDQGLRQLHRACTAAGLVVSRKCFADHLDNHVAR